ncbi:B9-type C2 domain like protein [Aduncisulcus paluster]|uniref:B9-type C2 domain like protein n=1 Tax=Aduncisulcus paluster TaxID=2918883 RepID=A0ABQ5KYK6_9EUKA|nr:B9-type C2 domain like protein [Aduncisulcus paluster]
MEVLKYEGALKGHKDWVTAIEVNSAGDMLVSGSRDKKLLVWDLISSSSSHPVGVPKRAFTGHNHFIQDVKLITDGEYAISASWDKTLRLWDLEKGICKKTFIGHTSDVTSVYVHKSSFIITTSRDKTVRVWNVHGTEKSRVEPHSSWSSSAFVREIDDKQFYVVSAGWDNKICVVDPKKGGEISSVKAGDSYINTMKVSPDEKILLVGGGDGKLRVFDIKSFPELLPMEDFSVELGEEIRAIEFCPSRMWVAVACRDEIKMVDLSSGSLKLIASMPVEEPEASEEGQKSKVPSPVSLCWNPTGNMLYVGCTDGLIRAFSVPYKWEHLEGETKGQTQFDKSNIGTGISTWSHPLDIHWSTTSMSGWPCLGVEIWGQDDDGVQDVVGYGFSQLPFKSGHHEVLIDIWVPVGSLAERFKSYLVGGVLSLRDDTLLFDHQERHKLRTSSVGTVKLDINIIARGFSEHGLPSGCKIEFIFLAQMQISQTAPFGPGPRYRWEKKKNPEILPSAGLPPAPVKVTVSDCVHDTVDHVFDKPKKYPEIPSDKKGIILGHPPKPSEGSVQELVRPKQECVGNSILRETKEKMVYKSTLNPVGTTRITNHVLPKQCHEQSFKFGKTIEKDPETVFDLTLRPVKEFKPTDDEYLMSATVSSLHHTALAQTQPEDPRKLQSRTFGMKTRKSPEDTAVGAVKAASFAVAGAYEGTCFAGPKSSIPYEAAGEGYNLPVTVLRSERQDMYSRRAEAPVGRTHIKRDITAPADVEQRTHGCKTQFGEDARTVLQTPLIPLDEYDDHGVSFNGTKARATRKTKWITTGEKGLSESAKFAVGSDRVFGIQSIRDDLKKPTIKRASDMTNYGDEIGVAPTIQSHFGCLGFTQDEGLSESAKFAVGSDRVFGIQSIRDDLKKPTIKRASDMTNYGDEIGVAPTIQSHFGCLGFTQDEVNEILRQKREAEKHEKK